MKKYITILIVLMLFHIQTFSQVGIGTSSPDPSAMLEVQSSTTGLLPPRMTESQMEAITTPAAGLTVFCTDCNNGEGCLATYINNQWQCGKSGDYDDCEYLYGNPSITAYANGVATINYICIGHPLTLTCTDNGTWTNATYYWTGPDNFFYNGKIPPAITFSAAKAGSYQVTIYHHDAPSCSYSSSVLAVVSTDVGSGAPSAVNIEGPPYNTLVKGTSLAFTVNTTGMSNYSQLEWTISTTGGSGVTFLANNQTTLTVPFDWTNFTQTIITNGNASAASFTVSVAGKDACGNTGSSTSSSSVTLQNALSLAAPSLIVIGHDQVEDIPTLTGGSAGLWSVGNITVGTGFTTPPTTFAFGNAVQPVTTVAESPAGVPSNNPSTVTGVITWTESYPAETKYTYNTSSCYITFTGCATPVQGSPASVSVESSYNAVVKGTNIDFTVNTAGLTNADSLVWVINQISGNGVSFNANGKNTLTVINSGGNYTQQVNVSNGASASSFSVSVAGKDACHAIGFATQSPTISLRPLLSIASSTLLLSPHSYVGNIPMVTGGETGEWTCGSLTVGSGFTTSPATFSFGDPEEPNTTVYESPAGIPNNNPSNVSGTITWTEAYPSTTKYTTNQITCDVTFSGCTPVSGQPSSVTAQAPYTAIVTGCSINFTVDVGTMSALDLLWTITTTGGAGVVFDNGKSTTLVVPNSSGNYVQQVNVNGGALATSFTVTVKGQGSCGNLGTGTTSSSLTVVRAIAGTPTQLITPHRHSGSDGSDILNLVRFATSGSWTLPGGGTTATPTYVSSGSSPSITVPGHSPEGQTITITNPTSPSAATIKEDYDVTDYLSADRYTITATWTENYPSTTKYTNNTVQVAVTFTGCAGKHSGYFAGISPADAQPYNGKYVYEGVVAHSSWGGKCWLKQNIGATTIPTSATSNSATAAGWYFQWDTKQGYYHDGTSRTPSTTWNTTPSSNSTWQASNDPCTLLLGSGWRIPNATSGTGEWNAFRTASTANGGMGGNSGGSSEAYNSYLRLHAAGHLDDGVLTNSGEYGSYWSSSQYASAFAHSLRFQESISLIGNNEMINGFTIRCVRD